ncbi:MAG TPA: NADH:flavin oxidoreductase/NADH oxidase [Xanthobacteraceae bacterium]|nr:NADH:flavin oxidoreductase/NADH oxidase [Xanthobacteraceae bacterium]
MTEPMLFSPITLREVTLKNRIVISPMCQYSAKDGFVTDWHFVHLGKFAQGGAAAVFVEASAVEPEGRITYGDVGIWSDAHAEKLSRIAGFVKSQGAVPAMQLAHAGRKASMQRPWHGNGPMDDSDLKRGETPWPIVAPSAIPMDEGWLMPAALAIDGLAKLREAWRLAAERTLNAGFEMLEVHSAHGYLLHEFLSPLSNKRNDAYGGDRAGRMRFPLEIVETVRSVWPKEKPLFVRISSVDGIDGGWSLDDSVAYARELKARGVDVVDCSSGGLVGSATAARIPRGLGFQVPFAERIRKDAGIKTMSVGLIVEPQQAEAVLAAGQADLIAIGREALFDPNWPLHARYMLASSADELFADWPEPYGWWLTRREPGLRAARAAAAKKA